MNAIRWSVAGAMLAIACSANGGPFALQGRDIDGRPVAANSPDAVFLYDSYNDLTWLRDWNYAATTGYDPDGRMNWYRATEWAAGLRIGEFDGWRLPETVLPDPTCVFDRHFDFPGDGVYSGCTASPMWRFINVVMHDEANYNPAVPIQNLKSHVYWTGTAYDSAYGPEAAWNYAIRSPFEGSTGFSTAYVHDFYAVAVRDGDVLPEPSSTALSLIALALAAAGRHRGLVGRGRGRHRAWLTAPRGDARVS